MNFNFSSKIEFIESAESLTKFSKTLIVICIAIKTIAYLWSCERWYAAKPSYNMAYLQGYIEEFKFSVKENVL